MSNTQKVSELVANIKYEDLPASVIEQVKRLTIHTVGVSVASAPIKTGKNAIALAEGQGGKEEAHIWGGHGKKVPAQVAAFANATQADVLDWEDCSWTGHPSAGAIAAAFAVAEAEHKTGKDYITAVAAAYEGYQRVSSSVKPSDEYTKTHSWGLSSWQIFGSTFAAAKLIGLDADKTNQAIGATTYVTPVAMGLHAAGPAKSDIYHFAHGTDAYNGIFAARIAEIGFDNGKDYLDGPLGYWSTVSDSNNPAWFNRSLNDNNWLINETYLKHWPANMWIQTPLEILDAIYKEHPFKADEITEITIDPTTNLTAPYYGDTARTTLDAQFNLSFCFAAYILDPTPSADWFTDDKLNKPEILELAKKIHEIGETRTPRDHFAVFEQGDFPKMTVVVKLKNGTVLEKSIAYPKGHPNNNTSLDEEYELFKRITTPFIGAEKAERFIKAIDSLETVADFADIGGDLQV